MHGKEWRKKLTCIQDFLVFCTAAMQRNPSYYLYVFSIIHPVDEFSFKEMRTWGQPKISSCCLCLLYLNQENQEAGEVQDSQHQWWKAFSQTFFQLQKVIGQSRIQNSVKHQRGTSSVEVCGAPLGDWVNGGCVDGLLHER